MICGSIQFSQIPLLCQLVLQSNLLQQRSFLKKPDLDLDGIKEKYYSYAPDW
jgi:hypothetical protein